ncbi:hypothetical protein CPARK_000095000 [cyanobacterium endosymbiont of Braarudosphaera bigelowii]|uniref:DUF4168 domain-containing protein n=3 Tax=Candidatus Atelocyanobacterium thalassae TaxID=713887 RepID=A0A086CFT1_9CHRO|nr:MAG: protein of unknown function (DUF4168) [Candidatus Atelocyanobacterium thalassa isolate SIO64986]BDA40111.1 hypothetical protein CPARK_000095000 [cyanobacterium endosymbiont of Braarudosphaera bigelowii]
MSSLVGLLGILYGCSLASTVSSSPSQSVVRFSDKDITNYAQIVLKIEDQRQIAYQKIEEITEGLPQEISCDQSDTLKQLPNQAQTIAVKFCNLSKKIAQDSGLSSNRFNRITEKAQKDTTLRKRIQNAMIRARLP